MASRRASVAWSLGRIANGSERNIAPLYHGLKRGVHLAYLAYAMWGLMWGLMWGRKLMACKMFLKIKIVRGGYPDRHGRAKALAPHVSGHLLPSLRLVSTN